MRVEKAVGTDHIENQGVLCDNIFGSGAACFFEDDSSTSMFNAPITAGCRELTIQIVPPLDTPQQADEPSEGLCPNEDHEADINYPKYSAILMSVSLLFANLLRTHDVDTGLFWNKFLPLFPIIGASFVIVAGRRVI